MDVDDAVGELVDEVGWNLRQEASKDDIVTSANSLYHESGFIQKLLTRDNSRRHSELLSAHEGISIATAGHDNRDLHFWFVGEVADDVFAVGAASCDKDGEFDCFAHGLINVLIQFGKVESLQNQCPQSPMLSQQPPWHPPHVDDVQGRNGNDPVRQQTHG